MLQRVVGGGGILPGEMMPGIFEGYINTLELHMQSMRNLKQVPLVIKHGSDIHAI